MRPSFLYQQDHLPKYGFDYPYHNVAPRRLCGSARRSQLLDRRITANR